MLSATNRSDTSFRRFAASIFSMSSWSVGGTSYDFGFRKRILSEPLEILPLFSQEKQPFREPVRSNQSNPQGPRRGPPSSHLRQFSMVVAGCCSICICSSDLAKKKKLSGQNEPKRTKKIRNDVHLQYEQLQKHTKKCSPMKDSPNGEKTTTKGSGKKYSKMYRPREVCTEW